MSEKNMLIPSGTWVQIESTLLKPEERAQHLPEETKKCPLMLWVKGFLEKDSEMGQEVTVKTIIGRTLKGKLIAVNPPYEHNFGRTIPELLTVGKELRDLIGGES